MQSIKEKKSLCAESGSWDLEGLSWVLVSGVEAGGGLEAICHPDPDLRTKEPVGPVPPGNRRGGPKPRRRAERSWVGRGPVSSCDLWVARTCVSSVPMQGSKRYNMTDPVVSKYVAGDKGKQDRVEHKSHACLASASYRCLGPLQASRNTTPQLRSGLIIPHRLRL